MKANIEMVIAVHFLINYNYRLPIVYYLFTCMKMTSWKESKIATF